MKRVFKPILRNLNKVSGSMMALLGFAGFSCENATDAYGSPYVEYAIKGRVLSEKESTPLEGIQVDLFQDEEIVYPYKTAYTDTNGEFALNALTTPNEKVTVISKDNGQTFVNDTSTVTFKKEDFKGSDGNWFFGKAEKELLILLEGKGNE